MPMFGQISKAITQVLAQSMDGMSATIGQGLGATLNGALHDIHPQLVPLMQSLEGHLERSGITDGAKPTEDQIRDALNNPGSPTEEMRQIMNAQLQRNQMDQIMNTLGDVMNSQNGFTQAILRNMNTTK